MWPYVCYPQLLICKNCCGLIIQVLPLHFNSNCKSAESNREPEGGQTSRLLCAKNSVHHSTFSLKGTYTSWWLYSHSGKSKAILRLCPLYEKTLFRVTSSWLDQLVTDIMSQSQKCCAYSARPCTKFSNLNSTGSAGNLQLCNCIVLQRHAQVSM